MKELEKISILEMPKKSLLSNDEQSHLLGGSEWNCTSYYECDFFKDSTCLTWDSGECNGEDTDRCGKFVD